MAEFENYTGQAERISREIEKYLIVLNIDWHDESALRGIAREAMEAKGRSNTLSSIEDPRVRSAHVALHGLIGLMLKTMTESASFGYEVHGSDTWKALAKALWSEREGASGG